MTVLLITLSIISLAFVAGLILVIRDLVRELDETEAWRDVYRNLYEQEMDRERWN